LAIKLSQPFKRLRETSDEFIVIEKRKTLRKKIFLRGFLRLADQNYSMACVVRDASDTGAKLRFKFPVSFTGKVELHIPEAQWVIQASVVWINNRDVGVSFSIPATVADKVPIAAVLADDQLLNRLTQLDVGIDERKNLLSWPEEQKNSETEVA
jgi:PilZ domain-containing protein